MACHLAYHGMASTGLVGLSSACPAPTACLALGTPPTARAAQHSGVPGMAAEMSAIADGWESRHHLGRGHCEVPSIPQSVSCMLQPSLGSLPRRAAGP